MEWDGPTRWFETTGGLVSYLLSLLGPIWSNISYLHCLLGRMSHRGVGKHGRLKNLDIFRYPRLGRGCGFSLAGWLRAAATWDRIPPW